MKNSTLNLVFTKNKCLLLHCMNAEWQQKWIARCWNHYLLMNDSFPNYKRTTEKHVCDATMPRQRPRRKVGDVYWWMEEIVHLKLKANRLRLQYQRTQSRDEARLKADEYQQARRNLQFAIRESKWLRWIELRNQVQEELYGWPYKIMMKKVGVLP